MRILKQFSHSMSIHLYFPPLGMTEYQTLAFFYDLPIMLSCCQILYLIFANTPSLFNSLNFSSFLFNSFFDPFIH